MPASQSGKLLAKGQVFKKQIPAGTKEAGSKTQKKPQRTKHTLVLANAAARKNCRVSGSKTVTTLSRGWNQTGSPGRGFGVAARQGKYRIADSAPDWRTRTADPDYFNAEPGDILLISMEIERAGYDVVGFTNRAVEALEIAYLLQPDIALIAVEISGTLDGIQIARLLRRTFGIPAILIGPDVEAPELARGKQALPLGYLSRHHKSHEFAAVLDFSLRHTSERRTEEETSISSEGAADQREALEV